MSSEIRYDPSAIHELKLLKTSHLRELEPDLLVAREEVLNDVELMKSGSKIPPDKQPLDAGFINLPQELLDEHQADENNSLLGRIEASAAQLRGEIDRLVVLGIGGSYMGARALFEALCRPLHNELPREARGDIPRISFVGNNIDNDETRGLLDLLNVTCRDNQSLQERWGITVISKSGGTLETALAFRIFRDALESYYGAESEECRRLIVPITGEKGKLRNLSVRKGYPEVFPIPDGVGGRFSVFTPVGLFPAAVLGIDIRLLLEGAAAITERFRTEPPGSNPVLDYTATCGLMEEEHGMTIRVLSTWGSRLEATGFWYDQLLSESLGKQGQGATPITTVNTRDLHSRQQQHQQGRGDKLITNVIVQSPSGEPIPVPHAADDADRLNQLSRKTLPELLAAAIQGTNQALAHDERPTADIVLPTLDEYTLGQLLQMLMLATVVEGRLIGINPYGQPGVEEYKKRMLENLGMT